MSDIPFYRTQMGHRFYGHSVPELIAAVQQLAAAVDRLATAAPAPPPCPRPTLRRRVRPRR